MAVHILSIHDESPDRKVLAIDLKEILAALGDAVDRHRFCILDIEATGDGAAGLYERLSAAPGGKLWVSAEELRGLAARLTQTIDAQIAGYPTEQLSVTLLPEDMRLAAFPQNRMGIVIAAVDSTYFEVYLKDAALADRVAAAFRQVKRADPAVYFSP